MTRVKVSTRTEPRTVRFNRSWNPCRTLRNSDKIVCDGTTKFPMQVGTKYDVTDMPWANGQGILSMKCEIKSEEKLTVSAGAFDTLRIECAGFWTRKFEGSFTGKAAETLWYAPSIGRVVKYQVVNFHSSGAQDIKTQDELVEFIPAK